jgi:hypothetical protein
MKFKLFFIIAGFWGFVHCEKDTEENKRRDGIQGSDLFFEPMDRNTVLFKCKSHSEGIKLRVPKVPDCKIPEILINSTKVLVTTYWADVSMSVIKGRECWKEEQDFSEKVGLIGYTSRYASEIRYGYLSEEECRGIFKNERTADGTLVPVIRKGLRGTSNHEKPDPHWYYFAESMVTTTNYYMALVQITVSNDNQMILPVGATLKKQCHVKNGSCPTQRGVLIWTKEDHEHCRVKVANATSCIRTGDRISCEETNMALVGFKEKQMCGITIVQTEQGVLFTTAISGEIFPSVGATSEVLKHIKLMNKPSSNRFKKSIVKESGNVFDFLDHIKQLKIDNEEEWAHGPDYNVPLVSIPELGSTVQFAVTKITDATNFELRQIHKAVCVNNLMIVNMAHHHLSRGDATLLIRTMTGDNSLRGTREGKFLFNSYFA